MVCVFYKNSEKNMYVRSHFQFKKCLEKVIKGALVYNIVLLLTPIDIAVIFIASVLVTHMLFTVTETNLATHAATLGTIMQ